MCSCCPLGCVATTLHTRCILTALRSKMTLLLVAMKAMLVWPGGKIENPERLRLHLGLRHGTRNLALTATANMPD